ncbi:aminotransferase class IV [Phenylobacterium sp.]|uniref:aminotransferase class IV n=1 Tax=Phenylobacterium sp. TaxID=1871053 RepID=UPI0025D692EE|nr:aminotransferase class IV [Phenylobacterium sp.]MBX3485634.1 aminotransferase class IV [Phenylobacterium sp.]MCW5759792.1 aminotransferase class IV [Phenylobacterium sp.]
MKAIAPDDRGFALGHGLFETILWNDHHPGHWDAHLDRLARGCKVLGLPVPDRIACRNVVEAALEVADRPHRAAVRLNWSAGAGDRGLDPPSRFEPMLSASAAKLGPTPGPASMVTAVTRRNDRSPASRLKTLSYLDNVIARGEARKAGADEALMLNSRGKIACAAAANVFWIVEDVLYTPAPEAGVLEGIMRAEVLRAARRSGVKVRVVRGARPVVLEDAPVFLTNSLTGVRRVARLDGRAVPFHPLVDRLARMVNPEMR